MSAAETDDLSPITPGEILAEEFLAGFKLTQATLERAIGVSPNRIAEIVSHRRRISADTALRLALFFDTSPEFWQNLQAHYDLKTARRQDGKTARRPAETEDGRRRTGDGGTFNTRHPSPVTCHPVQPRANGR